MIHLIFMAVMATNGIGISSIGTNSFFKFSTQTQPETLRVTTIGYKEPALPYFKGYIPKDHTFSFCWTNLVCETKFVPIVTHSNDTYYIRFKSQAQIDQERDWSGRDVYDGSGNKIESLTTDKNGFIILKSGHNKDESITIIQNNYEKNKEYKMDSDGVLRPR